MISYTPQDYIPIEASNMSFTATSFSNTCIGIGLLEKDINYVNLKEEELKKYFPIDFHQYASTSSGYYYMKLNKNNLTSFYVYALDNQEELSLFLVYLNNNKLICLKKINPIEEYYVLVREEDE